ncbi:hypothetical protein F5878DRAFT_76884 [Lentinula raphanica]|uniref:Uncharacterized protein n=1 Tax=Lentinula raphanica TaxID=153919 RepID=A0AA38NVW3_9AGAR|nr:hypothetical protein F5878DRAFT_76884 [Lentinula raphanica]
MGMGSGVPLNVAVRESLTWLMETLPRSIGARLLEDGLWTDSDADMVFWSDASQIGLSFVFAGNGFFYEIHADPNAPRVDIFFLELVAIMSAVAFAAQLRSPPKHILLYSDSLDSVDAFNSLAVRNSSHNAPLFAVSAIVLHTGFDVRVRHIPGHENI